MTAVVALTPAPVLDRTYQVRSLAAGKVNRAYAVHEYMSGKGLNVARSLHLVHTHVAAIVPMGHEDEHYFFRTPFPQLLRFVPVAGRVRVNTAILEDGGQTTNINESAVPMSNADWKAVVDLTIEQVEEMQAEWLAVCGTHPKNSDTNEPLDMTELFERARAAGARVALDSSGAPLARYTKAGLVDLIKPNADELAELVGHDLTTFGQVLEAAHEINGYGIEIALVSLGADGALVVTDTEQYWGRAVAPALVNTTGAGDATLAGFLSKSIAGGRDARGRATLDLPAALGTGCSWGALAVSVPTTLIEDLANAPTPVVSAPEPERLLTEPALLPEH